MKINEFLDAMASVDEKYTSSSESAYYGYGKKGNTPVVRRRLASASAVVLLLSVSLAVGLITASLFGVLPETVFGGHGAASSEQAMAIQLNEWAHDTSGVGTYSGRMSEEDSRTVLEIWNRQDHKKGAFLNISDVFFRVEEDYNKGNFEYYEYDSLHGLMQYVKIVNAYNKKKMKSTGGTYAYISGEDMVILEAIAEKYRSELVYWTLTGRGEEYRMSDGDRRAFSETWAYLTRHDYTLEEYEPVGSINETCTITVNNSYLPAFFRYYEDTGRIEYCYSGRNNEGEICDYSESRFAGDLKPKIDEIIGKYREGSGGDDTRLTMSPADEAYDALKEAYPDSFAKIPLNLLKIDAAQTGTDGPRISRFTFCIYRQPTPLAYVYDHTGKSTGIENPELEVFLDCRMNEEEWWTVTDRIRKQMYAETGSYPQLIRWEHSVNEAEGTVSLALVGTLGADTVGETVFVRKSTNATKIVDGWTSKLFRVCPLSLDPAGDGQPSFSAGNEGFVPGETGFLPIIVIRSAGELDAFINVYNSSLDLDHTYNFRGEESFTGARGSYGADFFGKKVLMLVLITAPSGEDRFRVRGLSSADIGFSPETSSRIKLLYVEIEKTFSGATDNVGGWLAAIEVDRSFCTGRTVSAYYVD